jgi:NitT/TauT family transport system permease protein/sulfonate transport system permease protein
MRQLIVGEDHSKGWRIVRDSRASGVLLVAALLMVWEASVQLELVQSVNWPAFSAVATALVVGLVQGDLLSVVMSTLWRMTRGLAIGLAIGLPLGLTISLWRPARVLLHPTIDVLRSIPVPALVPPLIFVLGTDDALALFMIAFATLFPVTLNTSAGVFAVEPLYRQVARAFAVPAAATLARVVFPAALPFIMAGIRTSLGLALVVTVVAEMLAGQQGVGYYLINMQFAMRAADMYAAVVLLALVAYFVNLTFVTCEGRLLFWARQREAMKN